MSTIGAISQMGFAPGLSVCRVSNQGRRQELSRVDGAALKHHYDGEMGAMMRLGCRPCRCRGRKFPLRFCDTVYASSSLRLKCSCCLFLTAARIATDHSSGERTGRPTPVIISFLHRTIYTAREGLLLLVCRRSDLAVAGPVRPRLPLVMISHSFPGWPNPSPIMAH